MERDDAAHQRMLLGTVQMQFGPQVQHLRDAALDHLVLNAFPVWKIYSAASLTIAEVID